MLPRGTTRSLALSLALAPALLPACSPPAPPASAPPAASSSPAASAPVVEGEPEVGDELAALDALLARHQGGDLPADLAARVRFRRAYLLEASAFTGEVPDEAKLEQGASAWLSLAGAKGLADRSAVAYQLGHALLSASRWAEAQQAFLALACSDRFGLRPDPAAEGRLLVEPKPHDHDEAFWRRWEALRLSPPGSRLKPKGKGPGEESSYTPIYDASCKPLPDGTGAPSSLAAEAWLRVGDQHLERLDARDGPYALHRAATAFRLATAKAGKGPGAGGEVREAALFRLLQTLMLLRRYEEAAKLGAEAMAGGLGGLQPLVQPEIVSLVAEAIARADQPDPPELSPLSPVELREDDELARRDEAVVARVKSPQLLPQGRPFTLDVYDALAIWLLEADRPAASAKVLEAALSRWPDDPRSPALRERLEAAKRRMPAPVVVGPAARLAPKPEKPAKKGAKAPRPGPSSTGIASVEATPSPRAVILVSMVSPYRHDPALPVVRRCAARLARDGRAATGRLVVTLSVADDGSVRSANVAAPAGSLAEPLAACVQVGPDALRSTLPQGVTPDLVRSLARQISASPYAYDLVDGEAVPVP